MSSHRPRPIAPRAMFVEQDNRSFLLACGRTVMQIVLHPHESFRVCREPVAHGRVLSWLAALRLPPWAVLVAMMLANELLAGGPEPLPLLPVHAWLEPPLARVLSIWLVLLVPIGVPLLYLGAGLLTHLALGLTGGAPRSIGASMRAVGFSYGVPLLAIGIIDIPLHAAVLDGTLYLSCLAVVGLCCLWQTGVALARTHGIGFLRGFMVALCPAALLLVVSAGRALLVLSEVPGLEPPSSSPYYIP